MKRFFSIILLFAVLLPFCAGFAEAATVTPAITAGSVSAYTGSTVDVPITLSGNPGITVAVIKVEYDRTRLKLVGVTNTGLLNAHMTDTSNVSGYPFYLSWQDGLAKTNNTKNGVIAKLRFQVLSTAKTGSAAITLKPGSGSHSFLNTGLSAKTFQYTAGKVSVQCKHDAGKWVTVKAATTTVEGKKELRCTKCQTVLKTAVIAKLPYLTLSAAAVTLAAGSSYTPTVKMSPSSTVKWTSSNTAVATVGSTGKITAKKAGTTTITAVASASGKKASIAVTVKAAPTAITLNRSSLTLNAGYSATLSATIKPSGALSTKTWKSSNPAVATISSAGKVIGVKAGTATITVTTKNGRTASCKVTVKPLPTTISLNQTSIRLGVGEAYTLKATISPASAAQTKIWTSANTSCATVSGGVVTGRKVGFTSVNVQSINGKSEQCNVLVMPAPTEVRISRSTATVTAGGTVQLSASYSPVGASSVKKWSSSNNAVATVNANGLVKGLKAGTATITVRTYNGKLASCKFTVKSATKTTQGTIDPMHSSANVVALKTVSTQAETVYQVIETVLLNRQASVDVSAYNVKTADFNKLYSDVVTGNPYLFYVSRKYHYTYYTNSDIVKTITPSYLESKEVSQAKKEKLDTAIAEALKAIPSGLSPVEKVLALNEYLVLNTVYTKNADKYTTYHVLVDKTALCQGYSYAFQYLIEQLGLECQIVTSDAMNHMWNMVKIDGFWYHVDVTWNDLTPDYLGHVSHNYLLLSDYKIKDSSHDHYGWNADAPSASSRKYDNYFWTRVEGSAIVYQNGAWCYFQSATPNKQNLFAYTFSSGATSLLGSVNAGWNAGTGIYYDIIPCLSQYNNMLYYNTKDAIYRINKDGSSTQIVKVSVSDTAGIYEMHISGTNLLYRVRSSLVATSYTGYSKSLLPSYQRGDVNKDGKITVLDAVLLQRKTSGWSGVTIDTALADVNKDGFVNSADALLLRKYTSGWNVKIA